MNISKIDYSAFGNPFEADYKQGWEDGIQTNPCVNRGERTGENRKAYDAGFSDAVDVIENEYANDFGSDF